MKYQLLHEFPISAQGFWDLFFSKEYNDELYRQLPIQSHQLIEQTASPDGMRVRRVQRLVPKTPLPAWAQSVIKDLSYLEHDDCDKIASRMTVRIEPASMKERFHWQGLYTVTPLGDHRCKREYTGEFRISMALLGGKLESLLLQQLEESERITIRVTEAWIQKNQL